MIILFHLKLYKFYCIGVMNLLKVICFFIPIKMSYYQFNRKALLEKAKDKYYNAGGKEEATKYYLKNRGLKNRNLPEQEKEAKRENGRNRYKNMNENAS